MPAVCAFAGATAAVHTRWAELERLVDRALDADPAAQFAFFGGQLLMQRGVVAAAKGDLDAALTEMINSKGPFVLNVMVPYQEHVLPMIPGGKTVKDIIKA